MRALLWIVGLFALAVALTVAARYSPGHVLLVLPSHRVEVSLNLAVVLLALGFVVAYLLIRALTLTLTMPARAAEFRREQQQARARRAFQEALRAYLEGRFGRAERAARQALQQNEAGGLSLVIAARSAHELKSFQARDSYLQEMEGRAPEDSYLRLMTQAELLLDERRYHDALQALSQLQDKHTAALRLGPAQLGPQPGSGAGAAAAVEKRKVFEPALLNSSNAMRRPRTSSVRRSTRRACASMGQTAVEDRARPHRGSRARPSSRSAAAMRRTRYRRAKPAGTLGLRLLPLYVQCSRATRGAT
jgi:HemY protein